MLSKITYFAGAKPALHRLRPNLAITIALNALVLMCISCESKKPEQPAAENAAPAPPPMAAQPAEVGVGKQGASMENDTAADRLITGPAIQLFQARQRAVFDVQIPHALNLYKALNGAAPKSHDEFVREILQANSISLPELKEGMVYRYNPEKQELWVYPANQAPN
ncbi:MAG: hypothetical protein KF752_13255 [Pirellulaceae bacterium]|nr:hypothetical protein [Pirellulaceae bacterium]